MKRTVLPSAFKEYSLPDSALQSVVLKSMKDPIEAQVNWEGGIFNVTLSKDGNKLVVDCTCEEDQGACIHSALAFSALLVAKKNAKPALIVQPEIPTPNKKGLAPAPTVGVFAKATKANARLRLALFGPSGSGKTYTALRIATGLGGKIAVIDTERGSAAKYADKFDFDVAELRDFSVNSYSTAMIAAIKGGYDILIIDSISHEWEALKDYVAIIAESKFKGNTWTAWSQGTPKQREFVDAMLGFDGHLIATIRSKTEWTTQQENGKTRPIRVGVTPEQRGGIEYEFDMLMELSTEHIGTVLKDRTGELQDEIIKFPGEELGEQLAHWLTG